MTLLRLDDGRMTMMTDFGAGMGAGWIGGLLMLVVVVLAIGALIKYLRS